MHYEYTFNGVPPGFDPFNPFGGGIPQTDAVLIEIETSTGQRRSEKIMAPPEMLKLQFIQLVQEAAEHDRSGIAYKITLSKPEVIYSQFEDKEKILTNKIVYTTLSWKERS